jgi:hypothetical protein
MNPHILQFCKWHGRFYSSPTALLLLEPNAIVELWLSIKA